MRAQVSTEFMAMVMVATIMIIIFAAIFSDLYQDNIKDKKKILSEDYGYSLQNEFMMAAESYPGYSRQFNVPQTLEGFEYDVVVSDRTLVVNYSDSIIEFPIPKSSGNLHKGNNIISNQNNTICVNC